MQTKRFLLSAIILLFCALSVFAAEKHFPQKLSWKADKYALEYKVEIQSAAGKAVETLTTEESSVEVSLSAGSYRYRVTALDILEREASVSDWTAFEILVAASPKIEAVAPEAPLESDGSSLELPVAVGSVTAGSTVELVNAATGKTIKGSLVLTGEAAASGSAKAGSETAAATSARFKNVGEGEWRLRVTNPSGLKSESASFTVKDVEKERLAKEKAAAAAEKERLAKEKAEAEQAERERLAQEKAEAEQAEREKLAAEKAAAEAEKERLAKEKAAAEQTERERLAQEKAAAAAEKERLAKEKAEAEKEARDKAWNESMQVQFLPGAGYALSFGNSVLTDYAESSQAPNLTLRLSYLPKELSFGARVGFELGASALQFTKLTSYYNTTLTFALAHANLLFQLPLVKRRLYVTAKAGGGLELVQKSVTYNGTYSGRDAPKDAYFGYATAQGGLSLFWICARHVVLEAGADVSHAFGDDLPLALVNPYLCLGVRL